MSIRVRIIFSTITFLILIFTVGSQPAKADGLPNIIPISGTATYDLDWHYSISGPSLSFAGGNLVDRSFYTSCTQGTLCDLSATINAGEFCNIISCSGSFDGHTYNWTAGTLTLSAAVLAPQTRVSVLTAPAIVSGQLFAVDCPPEQEQNNACNSAPVVFGFDIIAVGTVTVTSGNSSPNIDSMFGPEYSFEGIAVETPEPPSWSLFLAAVFVILAPKWKTVIVRASL